MLLLEGLASSYHNPTLNPGHATLAMQREKASRLARLCEINLLNLITNQAMAGQKRWLLVTGESQTSLAEVYRNT